MTVCKLEKEKSMNKNEEEKLPELNDDDLDEVNGGLILDRNSAIKCNRCKNYMKVNAKTAVPATCPQCGSEDLVFLGHGN